MPSSEEEAVDDGGDIASRARREGRRDARKAYECGEKVFVLGQNRHNVRARVCVCVCGGGGILDRRRKECARYGGRGAHRRTNGAVAAKCSRVRTIASPP